MYAQIAAIRAQYAAESLELERVITEWRLAEGTLAEQCKVLTKIRAGQTFNGSSKAGQEPTMGLTIKLAETMANKSSRASKQNNRWQLRLYIAGQTPKCLTAFANLKKLCETHMPGEYHIEIIDLLQQPQLAKGDQILAIPTLVRKLPEPMRKIIGDLSNTERVLVGLDVRRHDGLAAPM